MLFSVSGVEASPFLPPLAAFAVSFFTSMGGISGAFLLLPFQVSVLGYTSPSVSATNQFYNVIATPGGVWRYWREGRLLAPLALTAMAGTLPGVFLGALIRLNWLAEPGHFKLFAAFVLLYMALRMGLEQTGRGKKPSAPGMAPGSGRVQLLEPAPGRVRFLFQEKEYSYPVRRVFALTLIIGLVGGVYGIGGGAILAPFLVSGFALPVYVAAGPTLLCTFATSVAGVLCYSLLAPFFPQVQAGPDWLLGLLFGLGGLAGMNLGARCQKYVPARLIRLVIMFALAGTAAGWLLPAFLSSY